MKLIGFRHIILLTNVVDIGSSNVFSSEPGVLGTNMFPLMLSTSVAGRLVYSGPDITIHGYHRYNTHHYTVTIFNRLLVFFSVA